MTFKEFMQEVGYNLMTTFWEDFSIADKYGIAGVKDTYRRAFNEWKDDYKFFTELTLVLNHKIWQHSMLYIILTRTLCLSTGIVTKRKSHRKSLTTL